MGIKIIIAQACALATEDGPQHADVGDSHEVSKDDAHLLARMGRSFYLNRDDDPTKGLLTATKEDVDRIKREAKAIAADAQARAEAAAATPAALMARIASLEAALAAKPQA